MRSNFFLRFVIFFSLFHPSTSSSLLSLAYSAIEMWSETVAKVAVMHGTTGCELLDAMDNVGLPFRMIGTGHEDEYAPNEATRHTEQQLTQTTTSFFLLQKKQQIHSRSRTRCRFSSWRTSARRADLTTNACVGRSCHRRALGSLLQILLVAVALGRTSTRWQDGIRNHTISNFCIFDGKPIGTASTMNNPLTDTRACEVDFLDGRIETLTMSVGPDFKVVFDI